MDKIPSVIKEVIDEYITTLKKNSIKIDEAFLFGSYSKNNYNEWSDIDIALVSDAFSGNRIQDRNTIREYTRKVSTLIEVIPFKKEDFNHENPLAREIIKTGIKIM